jgi:hypothetical protein
MIVDNNLVVSGGVSATGTVTYQTVTGASAVLSTNTIDLSQNREIGTGEDLYLRTLVGTAFTGLTALTIEVVVADDAALTTNVAVVGSSGAIPVASLTAGARFAMDINPRIGSKSQRYMGARYTPAGTGTAGTLFVDLGLEIQDANTGTKSYPVGFAVL